MARIKKEQIKSLAVVCSAAVLAVIGSTMAYFTSTDQVTNQLIGSRFDITLTETKWSPDKGRNVVPGDELDKNPQIVNEERTTGYVFMRVTVPCDSQMVDNDDGTPLGSKKENVPMYKFMVHIAGDVYRIDETFSPAQAVNSYWTLLHEGNNTYTSFDSENDMYEYVYAYAINGSLIPLAKGETTEPLFDKLQLWNFNEEYDPGKSHSVEVTAFGIQADLPGYSADLIEDIWELAKGGSGE